MQRTSDALDFFHAKYAIRFPHLIEVLLDHVAVLSLVHYAYASKFSLREFVENDFGHSLVPLPGGRILEEGIKLARKISEDFVYVHLPWDEIIIQFLTDGTIDTETADGVLKKSDEIAKRDEINQEHVEIWQLFHSTFAATQAEFVRKQTDFLEKHFESLNLVDVSTSTEILRELGADASALESIERRAIEAFTRQPGSLEEFKTDSRLHRLSKAVRFQVAQAFIKTVTGEPLPELMERLTKPESYEPDELFRLAAFSATDFLQWLETDRERDTVRIARTFLERYQSMTDNEAPKVVSVFNEALDKIKEKSQIDAIRVERFVRRKD